MDEKRISINNILYELDTYLHKNDYASAEEYLLSVLSESAENSISLAVMNELMGLYRKLGNKEKAVFYAESAMKIINEASPDLPISVGEVIIENVFGSNVVATRNIG